MNKDATNYLLVDIGESGIMYMGVTGYPATGIQYLTRGVKLGSALQINNAKANYVFHLKEIRDSILEKCMSFETEVVTINLPSTYDNLIILPTGIKRQDIPAYIVKEDPNFRSNKTFFIYTPPKETSTGSLITMVSAVPTEYLPFLKEIEKEADLNITTSFTRLQFLADSKVAEGEIEVEQNFAIIDAGYNDTRLVYFDHEATPTRWVRSPLCGRDIINKMEKDNVIDAELEFSRRENLTPRVQSYINSQLNAILKGAKAYMGDLDYLIYVYGGLSTLPWVKVFPGKKVKTMLCKPVAQKDKSMGVKIGLAFDTPYNVSCSVVSRVDVGMSQSKQSQNLQPQNPQPQNQPQQRPQPQNQPQRRPQPQNQPQNPQPQNRPRPQQDPQQPQPQQRPQNSQPQQRPQPQNSQQSQQSQQPQVRGPLQNPRPQNPQQRPQQPQAQNPQQRPQQPQAQSPRPQNQPQQRPQQPQQNPQVQPQQRPHPQNPQQRTQRPQPQKPQPQYEVEEQYEYDEFDEMDFTESDDVEDFEIEDDTSKKNKKSKKPRKPGKKEKQRGKKNNPTDMREGKRARNTYDIDEQEEPKQKGKALKVALAIIPVVLILCIITVAVYLQYNKNAIDTDMVIASQRADLRVYVQNILNERGIQVDSCKTDQIGDKEMLIITLSNIAQEALDNLLVNLDGECNVSQYDIINNTDNTVSLTLTVTFK